MTKEINCNLKIRMISLFSCHVRPGLGWFRVFGFGLHWKDASRHTLFFSERNGYTKSLKLGSWRIRVLPKIK